MDNNIHYEHTHQSSMWGASRPLATIYEISKTLNFFKADTSRSWVLGLVTNQE